MKKLLLLLLIVGYANATSLEDRFLSDWNESNKEKFYLFLGLQAFDVASTYYVIKTKKGEERNPLYGKNPKIGTLLLAKAVVIPVFYYLVDGLNEDYKKYTLNFTNTLFFIVGANNVMVGANIKF